MESLIAFGDSITTGYQVPQSFAEKLASHLGRSLNNRAVLNAMAGDQSYNSYSYAFQPDDLVAIMVGTNDQRVYQTSSAKLGYYKACLTNLIVKAAAPARKNARTDMTLTGSWANTQVNSIGKSTTQQGAKAVATIEGTVAYIGVVLHDHAQAKGKASVKIDGVDVGEIDATATGLSTAIGMGYPPGVFRFGGLGDGPHTVEITVTTSGQYFYLDFIAGNAQSVKPTVLVSNVIRMKSNGYASYGGSDANVETYNQAVAEIVSTLAADGLDVRLVDLWSATDPAADISGDGIHPNAAWHTKAADAFQAVAEGVQEPPVEPEPAVIEYPLSSGGKIGLTMDEQDRVKAVEFLP